MRLPRDLSGDALAKTLGQLRYQITRQPPFSTVVLDVARNVRMSSFVELLERVRAGDEAATKEMFRPYETDIKRVVRAAWKE
jgi:hypothetical protein